MDNVYYCITQKGELFHATDLSELSNFGFVSVFPDFYRLVNHLTTKLTDCVRNGDVEGAESVAKLLSRTCIEEAKLNSK